VRQRLEAMAAAPAPVTPAEAVAEPIPEAEPEPEPVATPPMPEPRLMTGIERARYEAMQAEEREALEAEMAAVALAAARAEAEAAAAAAAPPDMTAVEPTAVADGAEAEADELGRVARRRALPLGRPRPSAALVLLPVVGAGVAWWLGVSMGRAPTIDTDLGRLTVMALVLAGPVATVGAIMARVWWPRLVGVVVAGALAACVFVGRSLIGA
jgi:hypothetical protein